MKTNRINLKVKNSEDCNYSVSIPLIILGNLDNTDLTKYNVIVFDNHKIIETVRKENTFYFERTDVKGTYIYKVQLKNEDKIIEEQNLEIYIKEEFHNDIFPEKETNIEIDDADFYANIKEIINSTDLKVGISSSPFKMFSGGSPVINDNDSAVIYKKLLALNRRDETIDVMCKIVSNKDETALLIWKTVTMLKYFKAFEAINFIRFLAKQTFKNKNEQRFIHQECITYLESVNSINNREKVYDYLVYFATECITPEARNLAVNSLIKSGKRNDERLIQYLFKIIAEDTNPTTKTTAIGGLVNFNITNHEQEIEELLQDALPQVRQTASSILFNNTLKLDFNFLSRIFEQETDKITRKNLCILLFKNYLEETKPFLLTILDLEDEDYTNTILDTLTYEKEVDFIIDKIEKYKNSNVYSSNLNKKIEDFLKRHKK